MSVLRVQGGRRLEGVVTVEGNKNAALPLIVASLLTTEPVTLHNVPRIRDVDVLLELLQGLGSTVEGSGTSTLVLRSAERPGSTPDAQLVGRVRASLLLMGPLLARCGAGAPGAAGRRLPVTADAVHACPGADGARRPASRRRCACLRGARWTARRLVLSRRGLGHCDRTRIARGGDRGWRDRDPPRGHRAARGRAVHAARRDGRAASRAPDRRGCVCRASRALGGASHTLRGDYIEAGTWAVIAAVTRGAIEVRGAEPEDLEPIVSVLQRMQVPCDLDGGAVRMRAGRCVAIGRLVTGLWPGFPSDMVSLFTVLATQAQGRTLIHDWMYELRLFALEQLSGMHADIFLCDSHRMVVTGPTPLRGRHLDTRDLRSGMALIAAALAAEGESVVGPLETVERGYAQVVERLTGLGAVVAREG